MGSEGEHPPLGPPFAWWNADLCQDFDGEDDHAGGGAVRLYRERQSKDSGQRRHPSRPAETDLRRQAVGGWEDSLRLQYSEGEHPPLGPPFAWWNADFREDID